MTSLAYFILFFSFADRHCCIGFHRLADSHQFDLAQAVSAIRLASSLKGALASLGHYG